MRFLPIFLDTFNKNVIVVGGGAAAEAKLRSLVKTQANISVFTDTPSTEISMWEQSDKLVIISGLPKNEDIAKAVLLYAATESPELNARLAKQAAKLNIAVNAADQKEDCSFYSPAIVDRSPLVVAIGSEGTAPGLVRSLKADLEQSLPTSLGRLSNRIAELRKDLADRFSDFAVRQRIWATAFNGMTLKEKVSVSGEQLVQNVDKAIVGEVEVSKKGKVALIGAGPGSLDLLTIGAQRRLHQADVVVYDRLVSAEVLDMGRKEAKYIYVGKKAGEASTSQSDINNILIEEAKKGQFVVRLKGGDPLIFGRADEEVDALVGADIDFELVPGITSAAAAAASLGVSLTARGQNKAVSLLTGHDSKGFAEQDWVSLSAPKSRAAIYMGLGAARFIQGRLLLHGADRNKPIAIVENASRENEIIVQTTLENLVADLESNGIKGPALLMLGYEMRNQGAYQSSTGGSEQAGVAL